MRRLAVALLALGLLLLLLPSAAPAKGGDRNRNAIPDRWERAHGISVTKDQSRRDADRDGLSAWAEWRSRTDPRKRDSDRDRRPDGREDGDRDKLSNGAEARFGFDPGKRDSDGDGQRDGDENAGVVRSVAGPVITIALARGGTLVAALSPDSDLGCDASADDARSSDDAQQEEDAAGGGEGDELAGDEAEGGEEVEVEGAEAEAAQVDGEELLEDVEDETGDAEPDPCLPDVRPGALVRSAEVEADAGRLVLVALELLAS
ncbi:MAG: hypothetical protein AVDCRST_MAG30-2340 [uncultured Solirubrobacteraceae bacterium]|uniref:Uncharacterized protein n=1 Tax=uncultured Solirubrobacteraceae bacterium TaxID=1162706 RepID=A0A6J4SYL5_9ACTN|nr:MAG: hypothetical protein AVDCRST_MAG30-2340 [uncultured Solirubrobacteraceae bacterium]